MHVEPDQAGVVLFVAGAYANGKGVVGEEVYLDGTFFDKEM